MILTVTMNASLDITYGLQRLSCGKINRVKDVTKTAGGKGLNVSRVLHQVGASVLATGLAGGTTGRRIENELSRHGIRNRFARITAESRNNITIACPSESTEILEIGPHVSSLELENFCHLFDKLIDGASIVAISGSLPRGAPVGFYTRLIEITADHTRRAVLDTSGSALCSVLSASIKPFAIKPNIHEIAEAMGHEEDESIGRIATDILGRRFSGIEVVIVSLGRDGALMKHDGVLYRGRCPLIHAVNPVGSGDALVAGFTEAIDEGFDPVGALRRGMTFGALNAMEKAPGKLKLDAYKDVQKATIVQRVEERALM